MNVGIVGLGLIGGSIGLSARARGDSVAAYDSNPQAVLDGVELGAADRGAQSVAEACVGADIVFVAGPVAALPALVAETLEVAPETAAVTDVGSTKGRVMSAVGDHPQFVGGHPVSGSEARGVANARAGLFEGATWYLTPGPVTNPASHRVVHGYVAGLGARPVAIDAEAHDRLVALTSHLPHALANVLANQAGAGRIDGHDPLTGAGGSFRDMTRVAGANPHIWVDIFLDNRDALLDGLREHLRSVETLTRALEREDAGYLARWIAEAAGHRRRMLAEAYATRPEELHRVRVRIPDRPGAISGITQALGAEGINIEDFELHHLSTDAGGTIVVVIAGAEQAQRAVALLDDHGYQATATAAVEQ